MASLEIIIRLPTRIPWYTAQQILGHCAQRVWQRAQDTGLTLRWPGHFVLVYLGGRRYRVYWHSVKENIVSEQLDKGSGYYGSHEYVGDDATYVMRSCQDDSISTVGVWQQVIEQRLVQLQREIDERKGDDEDNVVLAEDLEAQRAALQWALDIRTKPLRRVQHSRA